MKLKKLNHLLEYIQKNIPNYLLVKYPFLKSKRTKYKKILCVGDSLTNASFWPELVSKYLCINTLIKKGAVGSCMSEYRENSIHSKVMEMKVDEDVDLVTIFAGTNDYSCNVPLGSINNNDINTFYGSYISSLEKIKSLCKNATIILIAPTPRVWGNGECNSFITPNERGLLLRNYSEAIKNIAIKYSLPFINLEESSGINEINIKNYMFRQSHKKDHSYWLHYNYHGSRHIASIIASFISRLE